LKYTGENERIRFRFFIFNNKNQDIKCIKLINFIPNIGRIRRSPDNLLAVIITVDNAETTYVVYNKWHTKHKYTRNTNMPIPRGICFFGKL